MEGHRCMRPLKKGGTQWKYNLRKAVDLRNNVNSMELVLNLCSDLSTGFMEDVKGFTKPFCHEFLYRFL